jgi:hypothetical protein
MVSTIFDKNGSKLVENIFCAGEMDDSLFFYAHQLVNQKSVQLWNPCASLSSFAFLDTDFAWLRGLTYLVGYPGSVPPLSSWLPGVPQARTPCSTGCRDRNADKWLSAHYISGSYTSELHLSSINLCTVGRKCTFTS